MKTDSSDYSKKLAKIALEIEAIKLNPQNPFTWASGYRMPVYNDNRLLLGNAEHRMLVAEGFQDVLRRENIRADSVAGTATAGIPHATALANLLRTPLVYVRSSPKGHGMENLIEGVLKKNQNVVVIEDLVSTGGSSLKAVAAVRNAGGIVEHCLCIFTYGFTEAAAAFRKADCRLHSLLSFPRLIQIGEESGTIAPDHARLLDDWYKDPFTWGERHGFVKKN